MSNPPAYVQPGQRPDPDEALLAALRDYEEAGLVRPGWQVRWNSGAGAYVFAFTTGQGNAEAFTEAEFEQYVKGMDESRAHAAQRADTAPAG